MKLYLASGNAHKAREFQALADAGPLRGALVVETARALGGMPRVEEDTGTFAGNARKKALALRGRAPGGAWVFADDSGLCVDALGGAPGVESAYYAGPRGGDAANLAKLLRAMRGVPGEKRGAHFVCVLVFAGPGGAEHVFEGRCAGRIARGPRGAGGFGYDPVFVPEGHALSFAELAGDVKNQTSHRARAWRLAEQFFLTANNLAPETPPAAPKKQAIP